MNVTTSNQPQKTHFYAAATPLAGATGLALYGVRQIGYSAQRMEYQLKRNDGKKTINKLLSSYKDIQKCEHQTLRALPFLTLITIAGGAVIGAGIDALINKNREKKAAQKIENEPVQEIPENNSVEDSKIE